MKPMKTSWPRANIVPKINHDGRGLRYACAVAYVRLNYEKVHIFYLCYMKDHEASITLYQETWHQACLLFMLLALNFLHYDI